MLGQRFINSDTKSHSKNNTVSDKPRTQHAAILCGVTMVSMLISPLAFTQIGIAQTAMSQTSGLSQLPSASNNQGSEIDPNVERRDIKEFDIDSENVEITAFVGVISIEDFESSAVYGARVAYHINENLFLEGTYGLATGGQTSFESLSGGAPFLTDEQRDYRYYDASLGYNFNGELFVSEQWVFNTDFYLTLGAGSTEFGGDERFTVSAGAGYRVLFADFFAVRLDVRDHVFNSDIIGEEKNVHNLTFTLSSSFFF
ncbi:outer membrane beta-barrel domain-containing protein [Glaciecola siphonariae]|uniref:Outer membrane beta-barrel domain-containing protein n=1 Tax=Glaciecola siphonariae TaxID=521012 RepID=A0ABV9LQH4_9ALTE